MLIFNINLYIWRYYSDYLWLVKDRKDISSASSVFRCQSNCSLSEVLTSSGNLRLEPVLKSRVIVLLPMLAQIFLNL